MTLVLDASVALAWAFDRKRTQEADEANFILTHLPDRPAVVPALWHIEIVNALVSAHRGRAMTTAKAAAFLQLIETLPIATDGAMSERKSPIFALAGEYRLTAYDATYLELAIRTHSALATFDRALAAARDAAGVAPP